MIPQSEPERAKRQPNRQITGSRPSISRGRKKEISKECAVAVVGTRAWGVRYSHSYSPRATLVGIEEPLLGQRTWMAKNNEPSEN